MAFLHFLEGLRNPVFDAFFSAITYFGDETLFIIIGLLFFWCIDKEEGFYLLCVGLLGTVVNQFLKLYYRIPRPWVRDPSFTIVESAREAATGYSFPSGHTQTGHRFRMDRRHLYPAVLRHRCGPVRRCGLELRRPGPGHLQN